MRHVAGAAANLLGLALAVETQDGRAAFAWLEQPQQHADCRGLARAVRAEEAEDAAARHLKADMVHRDEAIEAFDQAIHDDGGGALGSGLAAEIVHGR